MIWVKMVHVFLMSLIMPSLWAREAWKRAISKAFQRLIFTTKGSVTPFRKGWKGDAVGWAFVTGGDEHVDRKIGI